MTKSPGETAKGVAPIAHWPKTCRCGETWAREHWGELTPIGRYLADEWLELRACVCGKTLAVPASELEEEPRPDGGLSMSDP